MIVDKELFDSQYICSVIDLDAKDEPDIVGKSIFSKIRRKLRRRKSSNPLINLHSIFLQQYLLNNDKEVYYSPKEENGYIYGYGIAFLKEDGSIKEESNLPISLFEECLEDLKESGLMDYDPYSDEEQTSLLDVRYKGKDNLVELCVKPTEHGREIVFRKPADLEIYTKDYKERYPDAFIAELD